MSSTLHLKPISCKDFYCSICHLAKQKHLSFVSNNNLTFAAFDLIHIDIWGPFKIVTFDGFKYFITVIDDCTLFTWVFLLKTKSEAQQAIPQCFCMVLTQFQIVIKGVRLILRS